MSTCVSYQHNSFHKTDKLINLFYSINIRYSFLYIFLIKTFIYLQYCTKREKFECFPSWGIIFLRILRMMFLNWIIIPYKILVIKLIYILNKSLRNYFWIYKPIRRILVFVWNIINYFWSKANLYSIDIFHQNIT